MSRFRVGIGYDVHRFVHGRDFILGGVKIPSELGLDGHSDADVLAHALMDALLGAARSQDIGYHFPDSDTAYKGASSMILLERTVDIVRQQGWRIVDADCVILLEAPKVSEYRDEMRRELALRMGVSIDQIGVKATTTERLGFVGRGEGVAAQAVVLLESASGVEGEK